MKAYGTGLSLSERTHRKEQLPTPIDLSTC